MAETTTKSMSKHAALRWLVENSPVSFASYPELGRVFGWERTKTWKVIKGWRSKGYLETETAPDTGRITVTIVPTAVPIVVDDDVPDDDETSGSPPARETSGVPQAVAARHGQPAVPDGNAGNEMEPATVRAYPVEHLRAPPAPADALDWLARGVAIGMACITAYFSIHGLLTLFPGDVIGVTIFGIFVECLKVVGVMYLSAHARTIWWLWRWATIGAVIIAAGLNSASVYARFAALHSQSPAAATATREASAAELEARIEAAQVRLEDLKRRSTAIDATVENASKRSNAKSANRVVNNTRGDRASLSGDSEAVAKELARLKAERGRVMADGHRAAAEELPVTLMASLFTTDAATVLRWLVCAVVICGDPAALAFLAGIGSSRAKRRRA